MELAGLSVSQVGMYDLLFFVWFVLGRGVMCARGVFVRISCDLPGNMFM